MKLNNLVSIVVPCYNVEFFVRRCISSLLRQTYKNIEVIAVNDCSTDNTCCVLNNLALEDERIVVHSLSENRGLGKVRDYGISVAKGKYIMFVDADDWVSDNTLETCVSLIEETKSDLVEFGYERRHSEAEYETKGVVVHTVVSSCEHIEERADHISCNKLYRLSIIKDNNLQFLYRRFEDTHFTRKYAFLCSKAVFIDNKFYKYFVNPDSITSTVKMEVLEDFSRTNEVIDLYLERGLNNRAQEYKCISRNFLLRQLVQISRKPHKKFSPTQSDSEFGYFMDYWIKLFNKSAVRFRMRVYLTLGYKYALKTIMQSGFKI